MFTLERLIEIAEVLNDDEREVWGEIGERICRGREPYGELDLDNDPRDFGHEAAEEAMDALVYLAADKVRKARRRNRGRK